MLIDALFHSLGRSQDFVFALEFALEPDVPCSHTRGSVA